MASPNAQSKFGASCCIHSQWEDTQDNREFTNLLSVREIDKKAMPTGYVQNKREDEGNNPMNMKS